MGTGYTRNDTSNNIADGNIINAADLDGEFDAIESAFGTSGHTHDGTSAEGGPITVLGPVQDFVASATEIKPKTTNTLDIGTSALLFKDMYLDGVATLGSIKIDNAGTIGSASDSDAIAISSGGVVSFSQAPLVDVTNATTNAVTDVLGIQVQSSGTPAVGIGSGLTLGVETASGNVETAGAIRIVSTGLTPTDEEIDLVFYSMRNGSLTEGFRYDSSADSLDVTGSLDVNSGAENVVATFTSTDTEAQINLVDSTGSAQIRSRNDLRFFTNGGSTRAMDITSSGLVGIGTSTPGRLAELYGTSNPALRINNGTDIADIGLASSAGALATSSTSGALVIARGGANDINLATNGTNRVTIDSSGLVGIGTTSPTDELHILGVTPAIKIEDTDGSYALISANADNLILGADEGNAGANSLIGFQVDGTERMRIEADGDVGFNTTSPNVHGWTKAVSLDSTGASSSAGYELNKNGVKYGAFDVQGDGRVQILNHQAYPITFNTNGTERVRIDSNGNIGIGLTPENSSGTWRNFEQGGMNLVGRSAGGVDGMIGTNYVFKTDNSEVYKTTAATSRIFFDANEFKFQQAASGTAGTAITWSEAMRIDSSGNVGIGTSSPSSQDTSANNFVIHDTAGNGGLTIVTPTDAIGGIHFSDGTSGTDRYRGIISYSHSDNTMRFHTDTARAMTIDSSGNVGIGTNAPDGLLHVYNDVLTIGSKTGDTSIQQNATALRIKAVPNSSTEWGGVSWYREFSDTTGATIVAERPSSDESDTDLKFKTATDSSGPSEHMRITHNGRIGIGTPEPEVQLDIRHIPTTGGVHRPVKIRTDDPQNNVNFAQYDGVGLKFEFATNTSGSNLGASIDVIKENEDDTNTDTAIEFRTSDNDETLDLAMHISSARNVHINGRTALSNTVTNDNSGPSLIVEDTLATSIALFRNDTSIASGNSFGSYAWYGNDTTSNTPQPMGAIQVRSMQAHTAGDTPTRMAFYTIPDGSESLNQNMILEPNKLELRSNGDMDLVISADYDNVTETDNPRLIFRQDGAVDHLIIGVAGSGDVGLNGAVNNGSYIHAAGGNEYLTIGTNGESAITISGSQIVNMPKMPAFHAYQNAAYEIDGGGDVELAVSTAAINRGSDFAVSGNRFTAPAAGLYMFHMHVSLYDNDATALQTQDDSAYITFKKNGVELGRNAGTMSTMLNAGYMSRNGVEINAAFSAILDLSASDYVEIELGDLSASRDYFITNVNFIGYMIG